MVLVKGYGLKKVREGSTYVIRGEILRQLIALNSFIRIDDSFLIGYEIRLTEGLKELFLKSKAFSPIEKSEREENQSTYDKIYDINFSPKGKMKAVIRDVKQGSWNEIYVNNKVNVIFDIGTSYGTKKTDIQTLVGIRNAIYQKDQPICVISHWDIDHYHCLIALDDATLKSFSKFICRGVLPNLTSRIIYGRMRSLNALSIVALLPEQPSAGRYSTELKPISPLNSKFIFYNGSENISRNKSGIGLAVRTTNSSLLLAADFDYRQVSKSILPNLNYNHDHNLVVPHHGGRAGKFIYKFGNKLRPSKSIISVGKEFLWSSPATIY